MKAASLLILILIALPSSGLADMYRWVDEKGTLNFADDLSNVPEKYRLDAELQKTSEETSPPAVKEKGKESQISVPDPMASEPKGVMEVDLLRRHELWMAEVILNERIRKRLVVDSGASFVLINPQTARDLGIVIDENTPFIAGATVSGVILTPLVTLKSVRVGNATVEDVEAVVYNMPSGQDGLLGNSFLNKFKVVLDAMNSKMVLYSMKGVPSADRPGGYSRDYWVGQFRFYNRNLADLRKLRTRYESQGARVELNRITNAIRYFENQLSELERKASFAGVPRNWRE
ncbi:MAG: aspartyl protease family protein [Syntrophaceae bacterium]|nr:aspartyl protease family protein [Syntrophaceae bacterium]